MSFLNIWCIKCGEIYILEFCAHRKNAVRLQETQTNITEIFEEKITHPVSQSNKLIPYSIHPFDLYYPHSYSSRGGTSPVWINT